MLIHIGYHKTGTTWLQYELFTVSGVSRAASSGRASPRPLFWPLSLDGSTKQVAKLFYYGERRYPLSPFDDPRPRVEALVDRISRERPSPPGAVPVISHERLSGNPHAGGLDARRIATDLQRCFPDARILIVIREQRSAILSGYFQYLYAGGTQALRPYLKRGFDGRHAGFSPDHFRYLDLVAHYRGLFGPDRVLVSTYEHFHRRPEIFFGRLGGLVERPIPWESLPLSTYHNRGENRWLASRSRFLNGLIKSSSLNGWSPFAPSSFGKGIARARRRLGQLVPGSWEAAHLSEMSAQVKRIIGRRYRDTNRELAEMTGLDLTGLGYD